jgi:phage shock protein A
MQFEELLEHINHSLRHLQSTVERIEKNTERTMTTQSQFDAALSALITAEAVRDAAVTAALNDLIAKVNSGNTDDLSAELAEIATLQSNAAAITATASGDDPGTTVITSPGVATTPEVAAGIAAADKAKAKAEATPAEPVVPAEPVAPVDEAPKTE